MADPFGGLFTGTTQTSFQPSSAGYRTDRHNNPTAFTTEVASMGLVEGVDYIKGDPFPDNPNLFTATLLGDAYETTIDLINKIGFYTSSGGQRWTHTAMSKSKWNSLSNEKKIEVIKDMYKKEGGSGTLSKTPQASQGFQVFKEADPFADLFKETKTIPSEGGSCSMEDVSLYKKEDTTCAMEDAELYPKQLPTLTFFDKFKDVAENPAQLVPFLAGGVEAKQMAELLIAANNLDKNKATKEDVLMLQEYVARSSKETTFGYKVLDIISMFPSFAGELYLTGGLATATKKVTMEAGQKVLKNLLVKSGKELLDKKAVQFGLKATGVIAGRTLQSVTAGSTRIASGTLEKQLDSTLQQINTGEEKESVFDSAKKAFGEQWVETLSEFSGGLASIPAKKIKDGLLKTALFSAFKKANPAKDPKILAKIIERTGWNGIIGEMFEERVGEVGHGILNQLGLSDQKFKLPSANQLAVEFVAFSVPGVAIATLNKFLEKPQITGSEGMTVEDDFGTMVEEEAPPITEMPPEIAGEIDPFADLFKEEVEPTIPGELEGIFDPLIAEAKKYKSAEEFVKAQEKTNVVDLIQYFSEDLNDRQKSMVNIATEVVDNIQQDDETKQQAIQAVKDAGFVEIAHYLEMLDAGNVEFKVSDTLLTDIWNKANQPEPLKEGELTPEQIEEMETAKAQIELIEEDRRRLGASLKFVNETKKLLNFKKFSEGDLETLRKSQASEFVNKSIEMVQEAFPERDYSDDEALEFIKELPTQKQIKEIQEAGVGEGLALESRKWQVKMPQLPETTKTINKTEITRWIEKTFNIPLKSKVTHKWKAAGVFYPKLQIIRMEKWGELSVLAHEVSHHIDKTLLPKEWRKNIPRSTRTELAGLDYDQKKRRTSEGFAEYMRYRMTTKEAPKLAPEFHKFFNDYLDKNPELKKQLAGMKEKYDTWFEQGAENRVIQHIDWKQEHTKIKGIMPKLRNALKFINEKFNDEFYVPQQIVSKIEDIKGSKLSPRKNPAIMMEYYKSKAGAIARTFIMDKVVDEYGNVTGPGLVEVLKPISNREIKSFISYAVSKRALNLEARDIESGFDVEDARFIVNKYKDKGWDETVNELTKWSDHMLEWLIRSGGLDGKTANLIRNLNPVYLTFKRAFIDEVSVFKGAKQSVVDVGGVVKRIKGSGRPIINPIEAMIGNLRTLIEKSQKIHIARLFADLAKEEGVGGFIVKVPAPMKATTFDANQIQDYLETITGERMVGDLDDFLTVFTQDFEYKGKENVVSIWKDGKREFYEIHPDLYESFKGIDPLKLGPVGKILAPFARMLRLGATGLKVSFGIARNPFRDAFSYAVFSKRNTATVFDPIKGIYNDITTQPGDITWRFKALGGALSGQIGLDRAATQSTYDELLLEKLGKKGKVLKIVKHPIDTLRDLLSITEMGPRSAEIEANYKKYTSDKWLEEHPDWNEEDAFIQAFNDAQDVTVNFTKSGKWAKQLNEITAFFNVAIRGPEKVYRSFKEQPVQTFVKGLLWLTMLALYSWYKNKDEDWYKNLPPAYKYNNVFFTIGDTIIRLPIPFELGTIFMAAPQAALDAFGGDEEAIKGIVDLMQSQIPDPTPSLFGPLIDVATNKNYLGVPIESAGMQYLYPTERKRDYTTGFAVSLSKGLDKLGIELSPIQLDYLLDSYSGGFLRQFRISGDELTDLPILGDLLLRDPNYPRRQLNDYFADYEILGSKKQADIATKEELKRYDKIKGFYNEYRDLQKQIKKAEEKGDSESVKKYEIRLMERLEKYGYTGIVSPEDIKSEAKDTNDIRGMAELAGLYVKALGVDPLTAIKTLFTSEQLKDVRGDAVIMERMGLNESQAIKLKGGAGPTDKLDHTVPLELGGDNGEDNLKIVTEREWASYTPVENYLGDLLNKGKIKEKEAQKAIVDFKDGKITFPEIRGKYK